MTTQCKNIELQVCIMIYIHCTIITVYHPYGYQDMTFFVKIAFCIVGIYNYSSTICRDVVLQSVWDYVVICYVDSGNPK